MKRVNSDIPLSYITVKVTKSRMNKGLLAIPMSLIDLFPKEKSFVFIENDRGVFEKKTYTPYTSTSRECRIGGMNDFYNRHAIENNDELVIQKIENNRFKLLPEKLFKKNIVSSLLNFENSNNEIDADHHLKEISKLSNLDRNTILCNEFIHLAHKEIQARETEQRKSSKLKESVSLPIRKILLSLYKGKCQISGFTFLMKTGIPYFEIHHINPSNGNHPKNLLVVCPNIHAQFTYARLTQSFDENGWLRSVSFNDKYFSVFQIIDALQEDFKKEIHFI
jgi:hypothetical protein